MKCAKRILALLLSMALLMGMATVAEEAAEPVAAAAFEEVAREPAPEPVIEAPTEAPEIEESLEEPIEEAEPEPDAVEEAPAEPVEAMAEDSLDAEQFDAEGDFVIDEGGVLVEYKGRDSEVTIPDGVKAIGERAFSGASATSIYVPDGVTSIGKEAFYVCMDLQSIRLPESLTSIGERAFLSCMALRSIQIPGGVARIEERTFFQCSSLQEVAMSEGLTSIGAQAFMKCAALGAINLPAGLTGIGESAFASCSSLQSVDLPASVTTIGAEAFSGCEGLRSVRIPNGVARIEKDAFSSCRALESVQLPDGLTSIGEEAFYGCSSLETLALPDHLTSIEELAFFGCGALQTVALPDGLTSIGQNAFSRCSSLKRINIPKGLTSIEKDVFSDSGLETVAIPSNVQSIGENAFMGCTSLTSVDIREGVASVGAYAFSGCRKLKTVKIPCSVRSIGNYAFWYCCAVDELVIPEGVTTIGKRALDGFTSAQRVLLPNSLTEMDAEMLGAAGASIQVKIYVYETSPAEKFCKEHNVPYYYRNGYEGAAVTLSFVEKTLSQRETAKLRPETRGMKKKEKYSFKSSDTNVASVSKTGGKITARNPGTATITVTGNTSGDDATCTVIVLPAPDSLTLAQTSASCNIGETILLSASIGLANASQDVSWSISKKQRKYASVDERGFVTALREGKVTVTATADHKNLKGKKLSRKFTLTVVDPTRPTAIHVAPETPKELVMADGPQVMLQLKHTLEPAETAESDVTWSIPKKAHRSCATVTKDGLLTAIKAGKVQLKVTAKKKSAAGKTLSETFEITIVDPTIPTSVTITEADGTPITQIKQIKKGDKLTLHATCAPETAASAELEWSSSNKRVAKVNKLTGEITTVGTGKAQITARAKKGGRKASVTIEVIK